MRPRPAVGRHADVERRAAAAAAAAVRRGGRRLPPGLRDRARRRRVPGEPLHCCGSVFNAATLSASAAPRSTLLVPCEQLWQTRAQLAKMINVLVSLMSTGALFIVQVGELRFTVVPADEAETSAADADDGPPFVVAVRRQGSTGAS